MQTEEFMFQNVAYRTNLYRTGPKGIKGNLVDIEVNDRQQGTQTTKMQTYEAAHNCTQPKNVFASV